MIDALVILGIAFLILISLTVITNQYSSANALRRAFDQFNRKAFVKRLQAIKKDQIGERKKLDGSQVFTYKLKDNSVIEITYLRDKITEIRTIKTSLLFKDKARKLTEKWKKLTNTDKYDTEKG